jgi:protocatechuate 3,4-dioxygenase beta subunit
VLPQGLELNPETGEISGYPEEIGAFQITLRFTNDCGVDEKTIDVYTCTTPEILTDTLIFNVEEPEVKHKSTIRVEDSEGNPVTDAEIYVYDCSWNEGGGYDPA